MSFNRPTGLAAGPDGELYIADTGNGTIRKMDAKGKVTTWATGLVEPTGLCWHDGALYVAETGRSRICRIVNGKVTVLAGGSQADEDGVYPGGYVDGPLEKAQFEHPQGIALASKRSDAEAPVAPITRGAFVTLLSRVHQSVNGDAVIEGEAAFTDVTESTWYGPQARWAADLGVMIGNNGQFMGARNLSRQELVTGSYRYAKACGYDVSAGKDLSIFPDHGDVAAYAKEAFSWAVATGMVNGFPDGTLRPTAQTNRVQAVVVIVHFMNAYGI